MTFAIIIICLFFVLFAALLGIGVLLIWVVRDIERASYDADGFPAAKGVPPYPIVGDGAWPTSSHSARIRDIEPRGL